MWPPPVYGLYPCSTKTREVLGNPSPSAERFPETREISRGRSPREIPRVEGCKTHGQGKSRGRRGWIFQSLPSLGGARTFSHHYQGRIDFNTVNLFHSTGMDSACILGSRVGLTNPLPWAKIDQSSPCRGLNTHPRAMNTQ